MELKMMKCMAAAAAILVTGTLAQAAETCGASGTIAERAAQCARTIKSRSGVVWQLVSRTKGPVRTYEVWRDTASGLLWGDTLDSLYGQADDYDDSEEVQQGMAVKFDLGAACTAASTESTATDCPI